MATEERARERSKQFAPKWRRFHPQSIVWVNNTLSHDIEFKVTDEYGRPFKYRLPAGKVSELPGGKVAELGLKKIVDETIQNGGEQTRMWEPTYRGEIEKDIILRIKEAPAPQAEDIASGVINLASNEQLEEKDDAEVAEKPETINPVFENKTQTDLDPDEEERKEAISIEIAASTLAALPKAGEGVGGE